MNDLLYRLEARPLGLVVVGVRRSSGYAYAGASSSGSPPPVAPVTRSS
jgi:hypothetical protein